MNTYTKEDYIDWVKEVKELYKKVKSHKTSYEITFLNSTITIEPNVFSPKYFNNTKWYAEKLLKIIGNSSLLEIGTGTGAIAIEIAKNGSNVFTTDINPYAIQCASNNFIKNNVEIEVLESDVFDSLKVEYKFDFIFWNHPYNNAGRQSKDILIKAGFDYKYNSLRKYIQGASVFLSNPQKGLLLGTGGQADIESITRIAQENGYRLKLLEYVETPLGEGTIIKNDFRIYELIKIIKMDKDDLWKINSIVSDWIKVADSKAVFITAIVGVLVTLMGNITNFKTPSFSNSNYALTCLLASIIYLIISISAAILSLYSTIDQKKHQSNIFFGDIRRFNLATEYLTALNENNIAEDLANQIIINSNITTKKHTLLQWSVAFVGLAILSIAGSFILSMI
jgi:methylase of polypeptide subunit release factors